MEDIIWDSDKIKNVDNFIEYISKTGKGEYLEIMADYYIYRKSKKFPIEDYNMIFSDSMNINSANEGQIKLAFICQCVSNLSKVPFEGNVYPFVSKMMRYCMIKTLKKIEKNIKERKISFNQHHLLHILKENFIQYVDGKIIDEKIFVEIALTNLDLCKELMMVNEKKIKDFLERSCVSAYIDELDISFLKRQDRKEFFDLLDMYNCPGNKTFFIRLLLVMIYESVKSRFRWEKMKKWINKKFHCNSQEDFINIFSSPLQDIVIFITSQRILKKAVYSEFK